MQKGKAVGTLLKLLPLISFAVPLAMLYSLNPTSFEATWKGRTYHLFFAWLILLETILNWETLRPKLRAKSIRLIVLVVTSVLPTAYVVCANHFGFDSFVTSVFSRYGTKESPVWANLMSMSFEYLVFSTILAATVALEYGVDGIGNYAVSTFFSGLIGAIYVIDNLYPYGRFTPFQIIVPMTSSLAMGFLNLIGYHTLYVGTSASMPAFVARDPQGRSSQVLSIAWPCSGVESLLIYSVTLLLFLKNSSLSWLARIAYFSVGAIVTYIINAMRIATIFVISAQGGDIRPFHNYYGQLYSIVWIISYPLIILGLQSLWNRRRASRQPKSASRSVST